MAKPVNGDEPFGFTPPWYELGIANPDMLTQLRAEWDKGEDRHSEHYRFWAFRDFLTSTPVLSEAVAVAIWEMAADDLDLEWTIRTYVVQRPECPPALLDAAVASGRKHLIRIVESRQKRRP